MSNQHLERGNRPDGSDPDVTSLESSSVSTSGGSERVAERDEEIAPERLSGDVVPDVATFEDPYGLDLDPYHDRIEPPPPAAEELAAPRQETADKSEEQSPGGLSEKLVGALETIQPGRSVTITTGSRKIQEQIRSIDGQPSHVPGYEYHVEEREGGGFKVSTVAAGAVRLSSVADIEHVKELIAGRKAAGERASEVVTTDVAEVKEAIRARHGIDFKVTERLYLSRPAAALVAHVEKIRESADSAFERGAPPVKVKLLAPALDMDPRDRNAVNEQLLKALDAYQLIRSSQEALREKHGEQAEKRQMIEVITDHPEVREFIKIARRAEKQRDKIMKALDEQLSGAAMAFDPLDPASMPEPLELSVGLEFRRLFHRDIRLELNEKWGRTLVDAMIPPENVKSVSSGFKIEAPKPSPDDEAEALSAGHKTLVQEITVDSEPERKPRKAAPEPPPKQSAWRRMTAALGRLMGV